MTGVVIGKFYPPHRGHKFLIDAARSQVDDLTVIVCDHPNQTIPAALRAAWLREIHTNLSVVVTPDDLPDEPEPWAARTVELLGRRPDVVFTSEAYGEGYAAAIGCRHCCVDIERANVPISAIIIRDDPLNHLDFLEPCVRAHFVKRIVLIGVESTGKTTLSMKLASALRTNWVPEYGREYSAAKTDEWAIADFVEVASEQQRREHEAAGLANKVLVCDTNAFATAIWHRRYLGWYSEEVDAIASRDKFDLYLLTLPDFPFVQDGTRDGEGIRHEMHEWFVERLADQPAPMVQLSGSPEERLRRALHAVDRVNGLRARDHD